MNVTATEEALRDEYLRTFLEATFPLQGKYPDREVNLKALILASELLKQRFEQEMEELRQEAD